MTDLPFVFTLPMPEVIPSKVDNHIVRRLSALSGQFLDQDTYNKMLSVEDKLIYEVYEIKRPEVEGELLMGVTIVHPGKVGIEFFETKGTSTRSWILRKSLLLRGEGYGHGRLGRDIGEASTR
jgi:glucose-6-phosphate isomerase